MKSKGNKENSEVYYKLETAGKTDQFIYFIARYYDLIEFGKRKGVRSSTKKSLPESKIKWNPFKRSNRDPDSSYTLDEWDMV